MNKDMAEEGTSPSFSFRRIKMDENLGSFKVLE